MKFVKITMKPWYSPSPTSMPATSETRNVITVSPANMLKILSLVMPSVRYRPNSFFLRRNRKFVA